LARINGVDLPRDKRVEIGLTYIFGIGVTRAKKICEAANVNPDTRVKDLTEDEVTRMRDYIDANYTTEGDLRREVRQNTARLMEIGCYRGLRHRKGLPVHGQRTHTNARNSKGKRRQIGARKKG
jgi:small subunit ribosomal protein S13